MDKKRIVASAVVFVILAALVYLQYRHWQSFDWGTFWAQTGRIKKVHVLHAIALIYFAYFLRAVRWKIFLQPVRPNVKMMDLVSPTLIGFTGLALLGRAGEFIRPYLIARRTDLPFSSQLAAWAVERIFDVGAFTVLMVLAIFLPSALPAIPHPEYYQRFREGGFLLIGVVVALTVGAIVIRRSGDAVGAMGGRTIWASLRQFWAQTGAESPRVRHRTGHDSWPCVDALADGCFGWDVVHHRLGVSGSHALLRRSGAGNSCIATLDSDGSEHARVDAAIAGCGRRFADGNDRSAFQRFRRASRDGRELRNFAVAGHVCGGRAGGAGIGASREIVVAEVIGGKPSQRRSGTQRPAGVSCTHCLLLRYGRRSPALLACYNFCINHKPSIQLVHCVRSPSAP